MVEREERAELNQKLARNLEGRVKDVREVVADIFLDAKYLKAAGIEVRLPAEWVDLFPATFTMEPARGPIEGPSGPVGVGDADAAAGHSEEALDSVGGGVDFVLSVLSENPGRDYSIQELHDALRGLGWSTKAASPRNLVGNLVAKAAARDEHVVRVPGRRGVYMWAPTPNSEQISEEVDGAEPSPMATTEAVMS